MAKIIEARVKQKKATLAQWNASTLVLLDGEQAFVVGADGSPINFKIGDGTKTFAQLPNWIAYDQAAYSKVTGNALPASDGGVHYSIVGEGTYTQTVGGNLVIPTGSLGIISNNGTSWSIDDVVALPEGKDEDVREVLDFFLKSSGTSPIDTSGFQTGLTNNQGVLVSSENFYLTLRDIPTQGKPFVFFNGYPMYTNGSGYNTILGKRADGTFAVIAPSVPGDSSPSASKTIISASYPLEGFVSFSVTVTNTGQAAGYPTTIALADNSTGLDSVKKYIDSSITPPGIFPPRTKEMSLDMGVNGNVEFIAFSGEVNANIIGVQAGLALVNSFRYIGFEVHNLQANATKPTITTMTLRLMENNERGSNISYSRFVLLKEVTVTGLSITAGNKAIVVFDMGEVIRANEFLSFRLTSPQNFRISAFANTPGAGVIQAMLWQPSFYFDWVNAASGFTAWCTVGLTPNLSNRPRIVFNRSQTDEQALVLSKYDGKINQGRLSIRNQYGIGGRTIRLFTNSLFSGLNPMSNFRLRMFDNIQNSEYFKGKFYMYTPPQSNGSFLVRTQVYDQVRTLLEDKITYIYHKPLPTRLTDNSADYTTWFFGDSLIHWNQNLIGKEFVRLINTDDPNETIQPDGSILTPTLNLTNQMRLVGAQVADDGVTRWSTINAMYTHVMNLDSPLCNPNSSQPRELDAQGFPRQLDLVWYLQQICGQGKYPKFICFAIGVNDIAIRDNFSANGIKELVNWIRIFIGKIKDACDVIAGGTSTVSMAQLVHQYYPNNSGNYGQFESDYQHRIWTQYYDAIEQMILNTSSDSNKKLSGFCRLIDASSRFDIDHGYTYVPIRVNDRLDVMGDYVLDTVHMGVNGAYQYADAVADDFMYHNCQ